MKKKPAATRRDEECIRKIARGAFERQGLPTTDRQARLPEYDDAFVRLFEQTIADAFMTASTDGDGVQARVDASRRKLLLGEG